MKKSKHTAVCRRCGCVFVVERFHRPRLFCRSCAELRDAAWNLAAAKRRYKLRRHVVVDR